LKGVVDADAVSVIEGVSVESEAIVYTVALMVLSFQAEGMGSLRAFWAGGLTLQNIRSVLYIEWSDCRCFPTVMTFSMNFQMDLPVFRDASLG